MATVQKIWFRKFLKAQTSQKGSGNSKSRHYHTLKDKEVNIVDNEILKVLKEIAVL